MKRPFYNRRHYREVEENQYFIVTILCALIFVKSLVVQRTKCSAVLK